MQLGLDCVKEEKLVPHFHNIKPKPKVSKLKIKARPSSNKVLIIGDNQAGGSAADLLYE
jgi:phosphoenolpyruvate carboxylase